MMDINIESFEAAVSHAIRLVGTCIEIFGVLPGWSWFAPF
jgi:hypothetical protein